MSIVEEGFEAPIDNFVFRQCPAEFKLKTSFGSELPSWTKNSESKTSLLRISHEKGIILFPHYEKGTSIILKFIHTNARIGGLAFAPIKNLAEKDKLEFDFLSFPGDESAIVSMSLDLSERFIFIGKASEKLYAVDLVVDNADKKPFVSKITQLDSTIVDCIASEDHGLFVLLANGKLMNLESEPGASFLQESDYLDLSGLKQAVSCMSQAENGLLALGFKDTSEIMLVKLNEDAEEDENIVIETISVPWEELGCGSKGISSIFMFADGNSALFACKPDHPEADDVPLLLLENIIMGEELKFSFYFDPCASRPPRANRFHFLTLPISKWADNLVDLVVLANNASPDLGICGRLAPGDEFQTFFIDNDEGLAQLPFVNGKAAYPLGMALDLSSTRELEHLTDPDAEKYPPAPIVWVLTDTAQLCPFYLLKTDATEPHSFMRQVPEFKLIKTDDESVIPPVAAAVSNAPPTPSKVPLQQLASLQKSTEINPIKPAAEVPLTSFKPAPVAIDKPSVTATAITTSATKTTTNTAAGNVVEEVPEPVLVKKVEKMESINVGAYQNILLAEIAATHIAMQDDLFTLKQLSAKNGHLLRQNSQKYFNSLESLETYAVSLEKLLGSSEKVFAGVKERVDGLKKDLQELLSRTRQVKSSWNRIKQDNKINWDARIQTLSTVSRDLMERLERVRSFTSNPSEASKYRATLKSFVDSAQEKVQVLMAHLSGLFVSDKDDISALDLGSLNLSPSLSSDNLLDQLNLLNINNAADSLLTSSSNVNARKHASLLNAVKARGARLLIPNKISPVSPTLDPKHLKLSSEDESLISSFISSVRLTEDVPNFPETVVGMAKLSIDDSAKTSETVKPVVKVPETVKAEPIKTFEFKSTEPAKPFEFKAAESVKTADTNVQPVKPFEFKVAEPVKPFEFKPSEPVKAFEPVKPFEFKTAEPVKPFEFKTTEPVKPIETKPLESFNPVEAKEPETVKPAETAAESVSKPFEFKVPSETSKAAEPMSKPFEIKPATDPEEKKLDFSILKQSEVASPEPSTTKIPTIFTAESVLKKESPLPTFDSLNFDGENGGGDKKTSSEGPVKPFPSIFGVKTASEPVKSEEKQSTVANVTTGVAAAPAFSFSFKPEVKVTEAVKTVDAVKTTDDVKPVEPVKEVTTSTTAATTSASAAASPSFSFSFAPQSSTASTPSAGFSITSKPSFPSATPATSTPSFGQTSIPAFGQTSIPSAFAAPAFGQTSTLAPAFGQTSTTAPAFGQTSMPSAGSFGSGSSASGFAAFASSAAASGNTASFSAFAPSNSNTGTGLTFATFLPDSQKQQQQQEKDKKPASSAFSFSGFRD